MRAWKYGSAHSRHAHKREGVKSCPGSLGIKKQAAIATEQETLGAPLTNGAIRSSDFSKKAFLTLSYQ